jgi:pimeloyl-ACP methyl ester carboxylesterase
MIRTLAAAAALSTLVSLQCAQAAQPAEAPPADAAPAQVFKPETLPSLPDVGPLFDAPKPAPAPKVDLNGPQDAMVAVDGGDDHLLYGSYLRPEGVASFPAVLILPAQGADRDGNAPGQEPKADTYKMLAIDLAAKGVATVRIDKRGVGGSAKAISREDDLRFDTYVDDAVTWAKFLQAQPHVRCVAILGHSEGALAAALAAKKVKVCAVIEVAGAGRTAAAVLAQQLKTATDSGRLDQDTYEQSITILNTLAVGKAVADPPAKLSALFRPSVQPYLISWLSLDPIDALRTATPVLILQGGTDPQVSDDEARRLAAVPTTAKLVIIPDADHDLKVAPAAGKIASASDVQPVSPEASTAIADFLKRVK